MFEFLSYGFGSVFGGLITALVISGLLLFVSIRNSNGSVSPLALIGAFILFCLLFYQFTTLYDAVAAKKLILKYISLFHLDDLTGEKLKAFLLYEGIYNRNPLVINNILELLDPEKHYETLSELISNKLNWFIFRRILWSLLFIILFGGIMFIPYGGSGRNKRKRKYSTFSEDEYFEEVYSDDYDYNDY